MIFGALPGLSGVTALAIAIPFTFGWEPANAVYFFTGIMGAVTFGGSVPAILLNTPGMAPNAATCFDGYPMAKRGEAKKALVLAASSSGLGAVLGLAVLVVIIPFMRWIIMKFGPPELFMVILFGLLCVVFASRGNVLKGLIAGGLGIYLSLIGLSEVFGVIRFTYGSYYLWDGIPLIPLMIGLFAITELIEMSGKSGAVVQSVVNIEGKILDGLKELFNNKLLFIRSSFIGIFIGIIPGVGGTVANFLSYVFGMKLSKNPETWGKGNPQGVIASEAANSSKDGGALVPTVAFGIPGSAEMAVLLGAFTLHGIQTGPLMIREHLDIVYVLVIGLVLANVITAIIGISISGYLAKLTSVNMTYIIPGLTAVAFAAAYTLRTNIWDVFIVVFGGVLGYVFRRTDFPVISFVIGFILGYPFERSFNQSLLISGGSYSIFFTRPISLGLFVATVMVLLFAVRPWRFMMANRRRQQ